MFNLKKYLWQHRIKKKEFAGLCKISFPTLRRIEKGEPVGRIVAEKVSLHTGCSVMSLLNPKN
jgi:hypothetical protein